MYVVDATKGNVLDILADLESVLTDRDLSGLPLLVLVNKVNDGGKLPVCISFWLELKLNMV